MSDANVQAAVWEDRVYRAGRHLNLWPSAELVSSVLRAAAGASRPGIQILDLGCGAGNNTYFLAKSGFVSAGIDISPTAIDFARKRLDAEGLSADLRVGNLTELPFKDESFHYVVDRSALTHNAHADIERALAEVHRILLPGGRVFSFDLFGFNSPDRRSGTEISYHCFDHFTSGYFRGVGLTSFFVPDDLQALFARFRDVEVRRHVELDMRDEILAEHFSVFAAK